MRSMPRGKTMGSKSMRKGGKHVAALCPYCNPALGGRRAPAGKVRELPDGYAVFRWGEPDPIVSGLATSGEGYKVLWALKHRRGGVTVTTRRGGAPEWVSLEATTW
jgi:hypothetical protein